MNNTITQDTFERLFVSAQQSLLQAPFPRKYLHSVVDDPQDALQAFLTLIASGYAAEDIHILSYQRYVEALERKHKITDFLSSIDLDDYLRESRRGAYIVAVRLTGYEQAEQLRELLAPHHARLMKYVDTWAVARLLP